MSSASINPREWQKEIIQELNDNILPFWLQRTPDPENGGFYGSLSNDLVIDNTVGRSAILTTRILWTFSAAYQYDPRPEYLKMATYAYDYMCQVFVDPQYGGLYWMVDAHRQVVMDRKHSYVQAFAIYSLSEYFKASSDLEALILAQKLFHLLDEHAYEAAGGGYVEGCARDWSKLVGDMRLSEKEPDSDKSMNTLLHVLEAYTNLYRVWKDPLLAKRLTELIHIFLEHVINPQNDHLRLFFDNHWQASGTMISFGHDIEASWLLQEAAEVVGDAPLIQAACSAAVKIASAVAREGLWPDGSLVYEIDGAEHYINKERHWWPAAEGAVGFYNAYQVSGQAEFAALASGCWQFAMQKLSDKQYGDWHKVLDEHYRVKPGTYKVGPWECPYHHARACLELIRRLGAE